MILKQTARGLQHVSATCFRPAFMAFHVLQITCFRNTDIVPHRTPLTSLRSLELLGAYDRGGADAPEDYWPPDVVAPALTRLAIRHMQVGE